jgi:phage protein D
MIAQSAHPLSPKVSILFNGVEVNYTSIVSLTLELDENKHDVCSITMAGINPRAITDYIDAAVYVSISSGEYRTQEFCGYVMYVEPTSDTSSGLVNDSPFQTTNIVCFGASLVMRGAKTKLWNNTSISVLAQSLADAYSFSLATPSDTFAYPRLVQQSESDWEFLTRVATTYGYRVTVHGTNMHIWDQNKALGRLPSYTVLTTMRKQLDAQPGMILRFEGSFGYVTPDGASTSYKTVALDSTGKMTTVKSEDLPRASISGKLSASKYTSNIYAPSQTVEEAKHFIEVQNKSGFPFNAEVDITAGAGIVPGGIVKIDEYNSNFDGIWYVRSVAHNVGGTHYSTHLSISRDFVLTKDFQIPSVQKMVTPPPPKFVSGTWMSSSPKVTKYV